VEAGLCMIVMDNMLIVNVSGAENEAIQAENWVSGNGAMSGGHRKRWSVSGARSGGWRSENGAESGSSRNALSVERLFLPLTLRSHALVTRHITAPDPDCNMARYLAGEMRYSDGLYLNPSPDARCNVEFIRVDHVSTYILLPKH
jgi:hypothetical protein